MKANFSNKKPKEVSSEMKYLQSPCSLAEAAQIARGVSEDVLEDYHNRTGHVQAAMSIQVELIKEILIESGIVTAEDLKERYIKKVEEFNAMQQEILENGESEQSEGDVKVAPTAGDVEVQKLS